MISKQNGPVKCSVISVALIHHICHMLVFCLTKGLCAGLMSPVHLLPSCSLLICFFFCIALAHERIEHGIWKMLILHRIYRIEANFWKTKHARLINELLYATAVFLVWGSESTLKGTAAFNLFLNSGKLRASMAGRFKGPLTAKALFAIFYCNL